MTCSTGSSGQKHFRLLFKLHDDHGCVQMVHFWHRSCPKMDSILNFYIVKNGWKFQFASGKRTASIPHLAGAQHSTFKSGDRSKIFHLRRKGWGWRGVSSPPLFFINLSAYYTVTRNIYFNIQDSLTVLKVITEIKLLGTTIIAAYKMTTNHFKKNKKYWPSLPPDYYLTGNHWDLVSRSTELIWTRGNDGNSIYGGSVICCSVCMNLVKIILIVAQITMIHHF